MPEPREGFTVEVQGQYGDSDVGVYLRDEHGEIVCWVHEEWEAEPGLVAKIIEAIKSGYEEGPAHLRSWLGRTIESEENDG